MSVLFDILNQWEKLLRENFEGDFYTRKERPDDPIAGDMKTPSFYIYPAKPKASPSDFNLDFRVYPVNVLLKFTGTGEGQTSDENDQEAIELQRFEFADKIMGLLKKYPVTETDCYKVDLAGDVDLYFRPTDQDVLKADEAIKANRLLFVFDHHTVRRY